jgi:hypothetical protein
MGVAIGRCGALAGFVAIVIGLAGAGSAWAVSSPVAIGSDTGALPAVAVDSSGTAYIAWANHTTNKEINFCRMPVGSTSCTPVEIPVPASSDTGISFDDPPSVILSGSDVYVFEDLAEGTGAQNGVVEFVSSTNPISFTQLANPVSYTGAGNAPPLSLPNGLIGVPYVGVQSYPTFQANTLASPANYSEANYPTPFATLSGTDYTADDIGNLKAAWAAQSSGASEGVLGVVDTESTGSCPSTSHGGLAYVYAPMSASTTVAELNTSTGGAGSPWEPIVPADCNGTDPAVAGGPSGLGLAEVDYANNMFVYRSFNPATGFGAAVPIASGATYDGLAQDGSGGIYAVFIDNGTELAYSNNGGASFIGPNVLDANAGQNPAMAVGSGGQGWLVFDSNGTEYAQPFNGADAVPPASPAPALSSTMLTTTQTAGTKSGASISIIAGQTGETDRATITGTNASIAGGTVHYYLYAAKSCDPGTSEVFDGGASTVTDGVAGPSQPVTVPLTAGTYYWQAEYSGDASNEAYTTPCGSEVLTVTPATTIAGTGSSTGTSATITVTCNALPCKVTVALTVSAGHRKTVTLGSATFKITKRGARKLTVHLSKAGRKYLRAHHGRLKVKVLVSEHIDGHTISTSRTIKITTKRK